MLNQVLAQIGQVKAAGDDPEQVLLGNDGLKIEAVEQMILPDWLTPHHLDHPTQYMQYAYYTLGRFSTPSPMSRHSKSRLYQAPTDYIRAAK